MHLVIATLFRVIFIIDHFNLKFDFIVQKEKNNPE